MLPSLSRGEGQYQLTYHASSTLPCCLSLATALWRDRWEWAGCLWRFSISGLFFVRAHHPSAMVIEVLALVVLWLQWYSQVEGNLFELLWAILLSAETIHLTDRHDFLSRASNQLISACINGVKSPATHDVKDILLHWRKKSMTTGICCDVV